MPDRTPEKLAELRRLLGLPWRVWPPTERDTRPADAYDVLSVNEPIYENCTFAEASSIIATVNALLDDAAFLAEVRRQVARGALCPMCSTGMTRQTVGMVCQLCGVDYGRPEYASLRRDSDETKVNVQAIVGDAEPAPIRAAFMANANPAVVLALLDERDALAAKVERVRDWLDHRGVDVSDRDGAYMDGYRAAQRHAVTDAAELRAALDGAGS